LPRFISVALGVEFRDLCRTQLKAKRAKERQAGLAAYTWFSARLGVPSRSFLRSCGGAVAATRTRSIWKSPMPAREHGRETAAEVVERGNRFEGSAGRNKSDGARLNLRCVEVEFV
jgi:hypothetical protein